MVTIYSSFNALVFSGKEAYPNKHASAAVLVSVIG